MNQKLLHLLGVSTLDKELVDESRNTTSTRFFFMNQETLASTGEKRRKAWMVDTPARRQWSMGMGA
jgi:hypothetical protein